MARSGASLGPILPQYGKISALPLLSMIITLYFLDPEEIYTSDRFRDANGRPVKRYEYSIMHVNTGR
jgi:hypothetical protein